MIDGDDARAEALLRLPANLDLIALPHLFMGGQIMVLRAEAQRRQGKLDAVAETLSRIVSQVKAGGPVGGVRTAGLKDLEALAAQSWGARLAPADVNELRRWVALARAGRSTANASNSASAAGRFPAGLSEREAEVLDLVVKGHSKKLIARTLDLSPATVKRHVSNVLGKAGVETRTEAATWWMERRPENWRGAAG